MSWEVHSGAPSFLSGLFEPRNDGSVSYTEESRWWRGPYVAQTPWSCGRSRSICERPPRKSELTAVGKPPDDSLRHKSAACNKKRYILQRGVVS